MATIDFLELALSYLSMYGQLLFSIFALGLSFIINRSLSNALITFSLACVFLYFLYLNILFIALASLALIVALVLKNAGQ